MSKKAAAAGAPAEEEWEDVEEEEEEEEEDTSINNSDVVMKYKKAAVWANEALQEVINKCKVGVKVIDLCQAGDDLINAKVQTMFRKVAEKGIAFPTSVSVNSCVAHNSPVAGEDPAADQVIALNDVVHIDLGVQVDGYCAVVAHTILVTENGELPAEGKEAHVIAAGQATLQAALKLFRPDKHVYDITQTIEDCAAHFGLTVVEGVLSHQLKRFIIDGSRCVVSKNIAEHKVHQYDIEPMSVWTLDVVLSTGRGRLRERDTKTTIYKLSLDSTYSTKLAAATDVQREIDAKFQTFPFGVRSLETKRARLGLNEMLKHGVVSPYPVLYERDGEAVAHFKVTLFVTGKKIEKITGLPAQKGGPALPAFAEPLLSISRLPLQFVPDPKKEKKADAAAAPAAPAA